MATWFEMLREAMLADGEDFEHRICTLDEAELKIEFDDDYGAVAGAAFTAWGAKWVYFPMCYDGSEYIGHAPRYPCDLSMPHQGEGDRFATRKLL